MWTNTKANARNVCLCLESLENRELLTAIAVQLLPDSYQTWGLDEYAPSGDAAYLSLQTDAEGGELWRTDGTEAGTELVIDLAGGEESSFAQSLVAVGDKLFFLAQNELESYLWGTPDGTHPIPLLRLGSHGGAVLFPMGDGVVFVNPNTSQLWTSDGTVEGTQAISEPLFDVWAPYNIRLFSHGEKLYVHTSTEALVLDKTGDLLGSLDDIYDETSTDLEFKSLGDQMWAFATSGTTSQLWKINSETDATSLVHHWPDTTISWNDVSLVGDELFYTASEFHATAFSPDTRVETYNRQLWKTDVNSGETVQLALPEDGMIVSTLELSNDLLYIQLADDGSYDLWRLENGTGAPESQHAFAKIVGQATNPLLKLGSAVFFVDGADLSLEQQTLYRYELSTGVQAIRSFARGIVADLKQFNDELLFTADDGTGLALWKSNGTATGTRAIRNLDVSPSTKTVRPVGTTHGRLLFHDGFVNGTVWSLDKSGSIQAIADSFAISSFPSRIPGELTNWTTDGTRKNTKVIEPTGFNPYLLPADIPSTALIGDTVYVVNSTVQLGSELFASDGFQWRVVKDVLPGPLSSDPLHLTTIGDVVYFSANDTAIGNETKAANREPWRSDGTEAGTYKLAEINASAEDAPFSTSSSNPEDFIPVERGLMFSAIPDGKLVNGQQSSLRSWYSSDGTVSGTFRLPELDGMQLLATIDGKLLLTGKSELWQTNGTQSGTSRIREYSEETVISGHGLGGIPTEAYFDVTDSDGHSLWRTDGTINGTRKVQTLSTNSKVLDISDADGKTFVTVDHPNGDSIWNATEDSLELIKSFSGATVEIGQGYYDSGRWFPGLHTLYLTGDTKDVYVDDGSDLFFNVVARGTMEKWTTDGSMEGTFEIHDTDKQVVDWAVHENVAYFNMRNPDNGKYETWVTDGSPDGTDVFDIYSAFQSFVPWNGDVYFTAIEYSNSLPTYRNWKIGDPRVTGDINDDGRVGFDDFLALSANYGRTLADETQGDLNDDQIVDFEDFRMLAANFGQTIEELDILEPIPNRSTAAAEALFASFMQEDED